MVSMHYESCSIHFLTVLSEIFYEFIFRFEAQYELFIAFDDGVHEPKYSFLALDQINHSNVDSNVKRNDIHAEAVEHGVDQKVEVELQLKAFVKDLPFVSIRLLKSNIVIDERGDQLSVIL